jgi:hypothetical protein
LEESETRTLSDVGSAYVTAMQCVGAEDGASVVWLAAMEWFDQQVSSEGVSDNDIQPHWQQTLKAAKNHVHGTKYSREQSEGLYATLILAWTRKALQREETHQAIYKLLSRLLSDEMDAPYAFYVAAFDLLASVATSTQIDRFREGWLGKIRNHDEKATIALMWSKWALTNGHARSAWDAIEKAKREIEGDSTIRKASRLEDQRAKEMAAQRLDEGWKEMLREVDVRKEADEDEDMDEN